MKLVYTVILMMCLQAVALAGERITFKWMLGGQEVGQLMISEEKGKEQTTYNYSSEMTVDYGEEVVIKEQMKAIYREAIEDSLLYIIAQLEAMRSFNDNPRIRVQENWNEDEPIRVVNGKQKALERDAEIFCYMFLFQQPPVNVTTVYSELYGIDFKVVNKGNNQYLIKGAKNREHNFIYDDKGNLVKALIEFSSGVYTLLPN